MTLKQIIKRLEKLAQSHQQINHFYFGDVADFMANGEVTYPALFVELHDGKLSSADKRIWYNFKLYFLDLMDVANKSQQNQWEIKSDLSSIAQDYIAMLNYNGYSKDWQLFQDFQMKIVDYQLTDITAGVSLDVTIGTEFLNNRCQVPAENIDFESPKDDSGLPLWYDAKYIANNIYTGLGNEGYVVIIPALIKRSILMIFQGEKLLDSSMYSFDELTGTITLNYELQQGQVLQVLTKNKV